VTSIGHRVTAALRRSAYFGARYGPSWWLRYSPGPFGTIAFALAARRRRALAARLEWVLGRPPTRREVLSTFTNFAHCLAESLAGAERDVHFEISGLDGLRAAVAEKRGVVLLTGHTGAWDFAAAQFSREFTENVVLVMQAEGNAAARRVHEDVRGRSGVRTVYVGADPLAGLELVEALRQGAVLAFQIDRPAPSGRAISTRLFAREFPVPEGPFALARLTGAVVIAGFAARRGFLHHAFELEPPFRISRGADETELRSAAQTVVAAFERFVARWPSQWFAFEPTGGSSPS
jgi:phosphatidylinositol dimannoside acyltransferase